jgi:uncharacterized protein (TIGR02996 family)
VTDHDALVRAVCAHPDDDTPRLVYADYLEESGEADRAAFVRAQVELARTPAWEPFAVLCRHRKREWSEEGAPFRHTLPELPAGGVAWHDRPFRRGLGWRVTVTSPRAWADLAPRLYEQAPVGEMHLNTSASTLDELRAFAAGEWLRHLRVVHLSGASPVEPIRVLCDAPHATGLTDIHFDRASGAGMPELVEDLLRTPLGRGLKGLHFRVGNHTIAGLIDVLASGTTRLERLSLVNMELSPEWLAALCDGPVLAGAAELDLRDNPLGLDLDLGAVILAGNVRAPALRVLNLARTGVGERGLTALAESPHLAGLRRLDLSDCPVGTPDGSRALAGSEPFSGLRSLRLARCGYGDQSVEWLTQVEAWANLVELDLRRNFISNVGARLLRKAPMPPDLTALLMSPERIGTNFQTALRWHFGERLILAEE